MRSPFGRLSILQKFFITLSIIFAIAIVEYQSFLGKSRKVELYDNLHAQISSARVSISKLEYLLDLFVVSWTLEYGTIDAIRGNVAGLSQDLDGLLQDPRYQGVWKEDGILFQSARSIGEDLSTIKTDLKRLNDAMSQEEIILLHNSVDTHTVLVTEKAEMLLSHITQRRQALFHEFKSLALKSVIGFVLLMLAGSLVLYRRVFSRIHRAGLVSGRILSGEEGARFDEKGGGEMGELAAKLNGMIGRLEREGKLKDAESASIRTALAERSAQLSAVSSVMSSAGKSLAEADVFGSALREINGKARSDAGAVYMVKGNSLKLKAAEGLDESFTRRAHTVPFPLEGAGEALKVFDRRSFPNAEIAAALEDERVELLASVPLLYNNGVAGLLLVMYRDGTRYGAEHNPFIEAVASLIAVASGHSALFQEELSSKKFMSRIMDQMPFGLAVFGPGGRGLIMNGRARQMLGTGSEFDPLSYCVFDDEVFRAQGAVNSINRSYDGYSTEFTINYSPMSSRAFGLNAPAKKLRVRSFPLYDSAGEISNMAILYEDLTGSEPAQTGGS